MRRGRRKVRRLEVDVIVVGIDSNYEPVTEAGWTYRSKHVYPYLERKGFKLTLFQGQMARRYLVAPEVAKPNVDYVTGVGHGLTNLYTGDHGDHIFQVTAYAPAEASGKIVHFLSCQTAQQLGPDFVRNGCRAYFGYDVNFTFTWDEANIFFECDSAIDLGFADGLTAEQVYGHAHRLFTKRIQELSDAGKDYVASALETDRDHLCAPSIANHWGDKQASLG